MDRRRRSALVDSALECAVETLKGLTGGLLLGLSLWMLLPVKGEAILFECARGMTGGFLLGLGLTVWKSLKWLYSK